MRKLEAVDLIATISSSLRDETDADMKDKDNDSGLSRRRFLTAGVAAAAFGSVPTSAAGRRSPANSSGLPTEARGQTIRKYVPKDTAYEVRERFVSQSLVDAYGSATITFEPELIPREAISDEYTDPDRPFVVKYRERAVVGSPDEHARAERKLRTSADSVSAQAVTYDGPMYVYKSGSAAENDEVSKRSGPINLDWTDSVDKNADEIRSYMQDRGWTSCCAFYSGTRYVLDDGEPKGQDTHVYQEIDWTKQYHVRLYDVNVSDSLNTAVVGQIHEDPYDHNQIDDKPWYFNESRDAVKSDWEDWGHGTRYHCTCATQWKTHDGNLVAIS